MIAKCSALLSLAFQNVAAHGRAYLAATLPLLATLTPWIAGSAISEGLRRDARSAVEAGPDVQVSGLRWGRAASLEPGLGDRLRSLPGVQGIERRAVASVVSGEAAILLVAVEAPRLARAAPLAAGSAPRAAGQCLVGAELARERGLAPGSRLSLEGRVTRVFEVCGVLSSADAVAGSQALVVSLSDAEDLLGSPLTEEFCLWTSPGFETSVAAAACRLSPTVAAVTRAEVEARLARASERRAGALALFLAPLTLAAAACFAALSWFVHGRREVEVAAYKLSGFSGGDIVFLALAENSLVGLCAGAAAGLGAWVWVRLFDAALLVGFFVPDLSPGAAVRLPAHFTALALAQGLCLALAATVTGSVLASWRLSNARPLGAFA